MKKKIWNNWKKVSNILYHLPYTNTGLKNIILNADYSIIKLEIKIYLTL